MKNKTSVSSKIKDKNSIKKIVAAIKLDSKEFLDSNKNANKLLSLQEYSEHENREVSTSAIRCLQNILVHLLKNGCLVTDNSDTDADEKYKKWLAVRYEEVIASRLKGLSSEDSNIFELNLIFMMTIIKQESLHPLNQTEGEGYYFPMHLMNKLLKSVLSTTEDRHDLISRFQEFLEYDDIKYYVLRSLNDLLKEMIEEAYEPSEVCMKNLLGLLQFVTIVPVQGKKKGGEEDSDRKVFSEDTDSDKTKFSVKVSQLRKYFTSVWLLVLKFRLSISMYKSLLVLIPEKVMPCLDRPLLLADFFLESYDKGGPISLLALNGVFQLMQKYHLEYPDFYKKFYSLCEPGIFHAKYRARFFYLADIFMSSTHLSEYLAAAFAKRMSRLCLTAPPTGIRIALQFIGNLMQRHPGLQKMMNDTTNQTDMESDIYVMEETDPAKCNALDSSFWELKTLQSHVIPKISEEAKFIDKDVPKLEWAIRDVLENTIDEIFEQEASLNVSEKVPVNFEKPVGFRSPMGEQFSQYFRLF